MLVVRPGFVKTRMTADLGPGTVRDDAGGRRVGDASGAGRTRGNDRVPRSLRLVFALLRHLPRGIYPKASAVRAKILLVDVGIAIVVAVIVLAITPGLAVAAAIAVVVRWPRVRSASDATRAAVAAAPALPGGALVLGCHRSSTMSS